MTSPAAPQRLESAHKLHSTPAVAHCILHGVAVRSSRRAHAGKTAPFANDRDAAHDRAHAGSEHARGLSPSAASSRCRHAKNAYQPPGSCGQPYPRAVGQSGKQHWPHGLSCPLAGLPPILITDRGNRSFHFSFFRTFKVEKRQYRFQSKRNQPRRLAVKLYEVRAVLPPISAPVLPPDNRPNRRVVHPITALVPPAGIRPAPHKPHHVSTARLPTVCC